MNSLIRGFFWTLVLVAIALTVFLVGAIRHAGAVEPACFTKDMVLADVKQSIPDASAAMLRADQTTMFAQATRFPWPDKVASFLIVVAPQSVGIFAFDADGCAIGRNGTVAAAQTDVIVLVVSPEMLKELLHTTDGASI